VHSVLGGRDRCVDGLIVVLVVLGGPVRGDSKQLVLGMLGRSVL